MSTIIGDVLLSSAFLAYAGYFNQHVSTFNFESISLCIFNFIYKPSDLLILTTLFVKQQRQNLFATWCQHLQQAGLQFRVDIARTEYLSNPDERLRWQANALPTDDFCTENAIMLKRFNRYPLIIDPSGQAIQFIMNEYKDNGITMTSFLGDCFREDIKVALQFGNPLLVQVMF